MTRGKDASHNARPVDTTTKQARVLDALLLEPDGLTVDEICWTVRVHLSRTQVRTTLTELRKAKAVEKVSRPPRWRIKR